VIIYGVAVLSACTLTGLFLGDLLGSALGVKANVGGVGIAMLLLLVVMHYTKAHFTKTAVSSSGIAFWSAMYIPIIVAMAAKQNVVAAVGGGPLALVAGALAVAASFLMIPLLSRLGGSRAEYESDDC
jgi:malonate transporter MadL subunit